MTPRPTRRNLGSRPPSGPPRPLVSLEPVSETPLAIRLGGRDFALEPGRIYLLGTDPHCDLALRGEGIAAQHARLQMRGPVPVVEPIGTAAIIVNGSAAGATPLRVGDAARLGDVEVRIVRDRGAAEIVPDPVLRAARSAALATSPASAPAPRPAARAATGGGGDETFAELMARELRRAPWLGLSLLIHAAVLLLLLWLFPAEPSGDRTAVELGFQGGSGPQLRPQVPPGRPDIVVESDLQEPQLREIEQQPEPEPVRPLLESPPTPAELDRALLQAHMGFRLPSRRTPQGGGDVLDAGGGSDNAGFRAAVEDLRRSGLDVVFVFDSTGSMGASIAATKEHIRAMLEVLRALVPDARFGLVTYRDASRREDYVVRQIALGQDFFAAVNFMQSVAADGGGDTPEAVLAGLRAAFAQQFRTGAQRVVVLAGDAPPHGHEEDALLDEVRAFARRGSSCVHALVTGGRRGPSPDTLRAFQRIAEHGRGLCAPVDDHGQILQQVLTLAFGTRFRGNVAAVQEHLAGLRRAPPTWALDLARRGGTELAANLRRGPPDDEVVGALLRRLRRDVACELVHLLTLQTLPVPSRHAISYVLQRQLELTEPPVEPERPAPISAPAAERLCELARRRLDP